VQLDPVIGILLLASCAILFASAALHKWRDTQRFAQVFAAYGLLPGGASLRLYWLVPLLESAVALGLLPSSTRAYACSAGILLLLSYAGAMALNLGRGRRDIACGCGGPDEQRPIAAWMVWRNVLLAALLASALWPWNQRALLPTDWLTIGFGIAAAVVVYLCVDRLGQVLRQARALRGTR
jgi:hypothetical protein